jgi:glyoxylase-like metal-dependent hydrolase (beta-lactamase superfamily II)
VFVTRVPAAAFGTNCYVVAPAVGEECLVVDPGIGVLDGLGEVLRTHRLRPAAVLLTHGHLDHAFSVTPVCGAHGVAVHVHPEDRYQLGDPLAGLDPALGELLVQEFGPMTDWAEPDEVLPLVDRAELSLAGLSLRVVHAPGHTGGSVMFSLPGTPEPVADLVPSGRPGPPDQSGYRATVLAGDVLFAGSIGRTDLPGGDPEAMIRTLRERVLTLPDDTLVLPGHGPSTSVGQERGTNPFLRQVAPAGSQGR